MIFKRVCSIVAVAVFVLCGLPRANGAEDPYEVPAMLSLTGPFAFLGKEESDTLHGVEVLANRTGGIRGRPLHFAITDIQSSPTVAVQVATQVLAKHPAVIMGPEPTAAVNALIPLVRSDAVLYTMSGGAKPPARGYVFCASVGTYDQMLAALRFLRDRGLKRIAIIATTDATGADQIAVIQDGMKLPDFAGISLVATERFAIADLNVSAQLARIKAAAPDIIWVGTTGTGYGTVLRGLSEAGVTTPSITNGGNIVRAQMSQFTGMIPTETYFVGPVRFMARLTERDTGVRREQSRFYETMASLGISRPDIGNNLAWDAAWVVVSALRELGPSATAEAVHSYMMNLHDFAATNGRMDFRDGSQRGVGVPSVLIVKWDPAKDDWTPLSDAGGAPLHR
jgi:branched-chain amino acid transport system substrate-binding protein